MRRTMAATPRPARAIMLPSFDALQSFATATDVVLASRADEPALAARRRRRLAALLAHAARHSPLYRELLAGRPDSDPLATLQALPPLHKTELMHRFDDWVADPVLRLAALRRFTAEKTTIGTPFAGRYTVWESSGSSGEPGLFVQDAAAMAVYDALEGLRRGLLRPPRGPAAPLLTGRIVFVGAIDGHFASTVSIERLRRLNPWLRQRLQSLSFLQPMHEVVAQLQAIAPAAIATYPSVAALLAEEKLAGRLEAAPREIWTGGETLSPALRHFVAEAFGCPVVDNYGASEFLTLAIECSAGRLHLNSDWAILEPVDAEGRPVPPGQTSATTLLTNLANLAQPLIRYDLGDRVTLRPEPCSCGSHLPVVDVQGRCDDTLRLQSPGRRRAVPVSPLALATVLEDEAGLFDFELVQRGPAELLLHTSLRGDEARQALSRARRVLASFLEAQGAPGVSIHCRSGMAGQRGRSGKAKRVRVET